MHFAAWVQVPGVFGTRTQKDSERESRGEE